MSEESKLGYWYFEYELRQYFSKISVGQGVNTNGWTMAKYAERWVEHDIEGYSVWFENEWSISFKEGVISAYKDFKEAMLDYSIGQDEKYYGYLRV